MNRIIVVGDLVRDPEVRTTSTGKTVCHMSVACDRGGKSDHTDFLDVVAWETVAASAATIPEGAFIRVMGSLQVRSYETADGGKRRAYEIVAQVLVVRNSCTSIRDETTTSTLTRQISDLKRIGPESGAFSL